VASKRVWHASGYAGQGAANTLVRPTVEVYGRAALRLPRTTPDVRALSTSDRKRPGSAGCASQDDPILGA